MNILAPVVAVSPLRQRLIDEMEVRRFGRDTQRNYIRDVGRFATWLGRSPDTAMAEELRRFQVEQCDLGVTTPTMNSIVAALRFFFTHALDRPDLARKLVRTKHIRKLPVVLSQDEVARLLDATTCLKHQAALSVAYRAGLRAAEIGALKVRDVDSERMLLRVERGKGGQYRNAMLPSGPLALLREWWKVGRQEGGLHVDGWLFPGQHYLKPISTRQLHRIVVEAGVAAGIGKRIGPHTLRHCFAKVEHHSRYIADWCEFESVRGCRPEVDTSCLLPCCGCAAEASWCLPTFRISRYKGDMLLPEPHLGRALRRWRVLHRIKQAHAAELIGVAQSTISRWEAGSQDMDPDQRTCVEALVGAQLTSSADMALARLIEHNPEGAHLICDHSHKLLALSATRRAEFGSAADAMIGQSLWRFATEDLARSEATLPSFGWHDLAAPPAVVIKTGSNGSQLVPIKAGHCRWTRLLLSDGAAVRLVETLG